MQKNDELACFKAECAASGRIGALDIGSKKIGVAISDATRLLASPYTILFRRSDSLISTELGELIRERQIVGWVVGWPLELDGREGSSCNMVREFVTKILEPFELPIMLIDERMSTALVRRHLNCTNLTRRQKDALDDKLAAATLLQTVLDSIRCLQ